MFWGADLLLISIKNTAKRQSDTKFNFSTEFSGNTFSNSTVIDVPEQEMILLCFNGGRYSYIFFKTKKLILIFLQESWEELFNATNMIAAVRSGVVFACTF